MLTSRNAVAYIKTVSFRSCEQHAHLGLTTTDIRSSGSVVASSSRRSRGNRTNGALNDAASFISRDLEDETMSASYRPQSNRSTGGPPSVAAGPSRTRSASRQRPRESFSPQRIPRDLAAVRQKQAAESARVETPNLTEFMAPSSTIAPASMHRSSTFRGPSLEDTNGNLDPFSGDNITSPDQPLLDDSPRKVRTPGAFKSINPGVSEPDNDIEPSQLVDTEKHMKKKGRKKGTDKVDKKKEKSKEKKKKKKKQKKEKAKTDQTSNNTTTETGGKHISTSRVGQDDADNRKGISKSAPSNHTNPAKTLKPKAPETSGQASRGNMGPPPTKGQPEKPLTGSNTIPIGPRAWLRQQGTPGTVSSLTIVYDEHNRNRQAHQSSPSKRKFDCLNDETKDYSLKPPAPLIGIQQKSFGSNRLATSSGFGPDVIQAAKRHKYNLTYPIHRGPPSTSTNLYSVSSRYGTPRSQVTPSYDRRSSAGHNRGSLASRGGPGSYRHRSSSGRLHPRFKKEKSHDVMYRGSDQQNVPFIDLTESP